MGVDESRWFEMEHCPRLPAHVLIRPVSNPRQLLVEGYDSFKSAEEEVRVSATE